MGINLGAGGSGNGNKQLETETEKDIATHLYLLPWGQLETGSERRRRRC